MPPEKEKCQWAQSSLNNTESPRKKFFCYDAMEEHETGPPFPWIQRYDHAQKSLRTPFISFAAQGTT